MEPRTAVGTPAPYRLVASFLVAGLVSWLLAAAAFLRAAPDLAAGRVASPEVLLAVHLLALGFLPLAVAGAALHVLPTLLRNSAGRWRGRIGLAGLCAGPFLAVGIARHRPGLAWPAATLVGLGLAALLVEVAVLTARAPRGRMLLASRFGVAASAVHALAAFLLGAVLFAREWRPWLGIPHERLIAIHVHLAVLGWLTLLIVAVGRTLVPMLALAPSERPRRLPLEEAALAAGVWLVAAGFALDLKILLAAGYAATLAALARFGRVLLRAAREARLEAMEGPIAHVLAGVAFLVQAAVLAVILLAEPGSPRLLTAYVLLLLLGWAAGVTLGHAGKLLALSAWTWWPPGPRPKQADLYDRRAWVAGAAAFAAGTELLAGGILSGSAGVAQAGGAALVLSALAALRGAVHTLAAAGRTRAGGSGRA